MQKERNDGRKMKFRKEERTKERKNERKLDKRRRKS